MIDHNPPPPPPVEGIKAESCFAAEHRGDTVQWDKAERCFEAGKSMKVPGGRG